MISSIRLLLLTYFLTGIVMVVIAILSHSVYIMLASSLSLILFLWYITYHLLKHIKKLTNELTNRAATHLELLKLEKMPHELQALVNELNELFSRIRQTLQRNKQFASDAAHELRTPLAALKTQAEVAKQASTDKERNTALTCVIKGVDRSTHLVDQLLTLGRLGPEATLNNITLVDLEKLAAEIMARLVPEALKKNIDIELIAQIHGLTILANEVSLTILMRNLIDNAIRYTPKHGTVHVFILQKDNRIIFRVQDNGPGISHELHQRIFERFFRVLGTKTTGSGLGLAIVKQIADLHKAEIRLTKPEHGPGLCVDIIFLKVD